MVELPLPHEPGKVTSDPGLEKTGPFHLVRRLGQGGFAPVYLAEEIHEGRKLRDVALKLFFLRGERGAAAAGDPAAEAELRDRILDEARALCRVEHPNVVRFYAVHRDDAQGVLGLAMELLRGEALDVRLRSAGPLNEVEAIEAGAAVAWALSAVHDAGLIHGDVKPGNVVRGPNGYKLIDFGIAADLSVRGGAPTAIAGTPGYLAPERLRGAPPSPATDLYALGAMLHKLRYGALPEPTFVMKDEGANVANRSPEARTESFDAAAAERAAAAGPAPAQDEQALAMRDDGSHQSPTDRAAGPPVSLDGLMARLLSPDPHARPRHAAQVAHDLAALLGARTFVPSVSPPPNSGAAQETVASARGLGNKPAPSASGAPTLHPHPPLAGRDAELSTLGAGAQRARGGRAQVTLIRGPLGSGRTRVLDAAIAAAGAAEGRVLRCSCSPERKSPLLPLSRALDAATRTGRGLSAIAEAIEEAATPGALRSSREVRAAVEAVEEALVWAASRELLVLALDDVQWGDPHTLSLLGLLAGRAREGGEGHLFVVIAARDEPRPPAEMRALLAAITPRADGATASISLGPLSDEELARVAAGVGPLSPELLAAVVRGSGGVPFFLIHALFAWRDTRAIVLRDGAWHAADPHLLSAAVPGVGELLEARLASVFEPGSKRGRAAQRALAAVALYGGGLPVETLLAVCGDATSSSAALETLVSMQALVVAGPRCEHSFAQEMVRLSVLSLLRARPWFQQLHRALLDRLARGPGSFADAAFLASGYDALGAAEPARLWLRRAMEAAVRSGLLAEAAEMAARRAALSEKGDERADAQLDVVRALVLGRRFEEAELRLRALASEARAELPLPLDLRRRILRLAAVRGLNSQADDPTLIRDADASGDLALRCEARMALAALAGGDRAVEIAGSAVELSRQGDPSIEYAARVGRAELIYAADTRDLALAHRDLSRALAIAEVTSSRLHRLQIESDLAVIDADRGETALAIERLGRLAGQAEALGMRSEKRRLVQNRAAMLLREGRASEAAECAAEAARLAREAGDPALFANACSVRADALRREGDLSGALASIDDALHIQRERRDPMRALSLLRRADILAALGRVTEAELDAGEARAVAGHSGERWIGIAAALWEALHRTQLGKASKDELIQALAAAQAPDVAPRALVRSLASRARAFLSGEPEVPSR